MDKELGRLLASVGKEAVKLTVGTLATVWVAGFVVNPARKDLCEKTAQTARYARHKMGGSGIDIRYEWK